MRTATLTISIDIEEEDGLDERPDDFWCAELLLEVVASQTDQALLQAEHDVGLTMRFQ